MVSKFTVPPAGLPNEGLRKKLNLKHWLSKKKNVLRQEVIFLQAAKSNWIYLENAAVSLKMHCLLVCLYFLKCL